MWLVLGSDVSLAASKTVYLSPWTTTSSSALLTLCMRYFTVWVPCLYHLSLTRCPTLGAGQAMQEPQGSYTHRQQHCCSAQCDRTKI